MSLIEQLMPKLRRHPKRIVFPEGGDPRILQAARQLSREGLAVPVLLGERAEIKNNAARLDLKLDGIRIIEPERSDDLELFLPMMQELPRFSGSEISAQRELLLKRNYFASMMLATGRVDALVSGATSTASSALRPLFQLIPKQPHVTSASSLLILDMENSKLGMEGVLFLADCGVIPEPSEDQLADIAVITAEIASHLTGKIPRVAMLSFSTRSDSEPRQATVARVRQATAIAIQKASCSKIHIEVDGELQLDAALDLSVAEQKDVGDSKVAGKANVLVFPDLNSGNIVSKMVQVITGTRSYGQIITGLSKPCAEISRGAHAHDIFGTAVIVAVQAIDRHLLYAAEPVENRQ